LRQDPPQSSNICKQHLTDPCWEIFVEKPVWDRLASAYGRAEPDIFSAFAHRLVHVIPSDPGATVLDLACGTGALASAIWQLAAPARLVAADLSVEMLRQAASVLRQQNALCAMAAMNAQQLAFTDQAFDTVLCGSALDSFPDPIRALAETRRILRPGGVLGLWVAPSWWWQGDPRWDWHVDVLVSLGADVGQAPAGLDRPESLHQMIESVGFQDVRIHADELGLHFSSPSQWWQWAWSHGFRQVLERLPADQLAFYRAVAFERIGRGGIDGRVQALLATAFRR
jgi:SAM-dependent methyltransferase